MSPGTFNLTYELGEPGSACYDTDQQAITVYPAPYIVQVNMIQPGNQGVFHLVAEGQPGSPSNGSSLGICWPQATPCTTTSSKNSC